MPPKQYQLEWKLKEAKILLKSGKYSIREVGEMLGFNYETHFQRLFSQRFNMSPGAWKER